VGAAGRGRGLVGTLWGAQRPVRPSGRDLEPAPRHARVPAMTTLSQDSGDASAGTGEPGDEASIGDRRREGWLGRPAFKITRHPGQ